MLRTGNNGITERQLHWSSEHCEFIDVTQTKPAAGFVKGPIPLIWISRAACLPGKTFHVGIALWYLAGLKKTFSFALSNKTLGLFGVSRDAKYEALDRLEVAGLISVQRVSGRSPIVTLITN